MAIGLPEAADFEEWPSFDLMDSGLLAPIFPPRRGIRLLGVSLSSLERQTLQTEPQLRLAL
ncbi:hypothetical protein CN934_19035 [Ensifer sp. MMN_5]|nr:hypothetical protein CN934_19035 [Ensifer sp. MMN_5]PND23989.1 hypothetical protein CN933_30035 [Sinorhizobium sp. M4_45]